VRFDLAACREFADQDLECSHETEIAERRRPQVFDDPALEGDASVQSLVEVHQPLHRIGAERRAQPRFEASHVELGCREQCAQLVVQFARKPKALVFAHGLQVLSELLQLDRAAGHLGFEPVALARDAA